MGDLQDIMNSMLLSETVYKAYDSGPEAAAHAFRDLQRGFAPGLITVASMQCSLPHIQQRYRLFIGFFHAFCRPLVMPDNLCRRCMHASVTEACCGLGRRYLVASSKDALYVAFMGTKAVRDFLSDANYVQAAIWPGLALPGLTAVAFKITLNCCKSEVRALFLKVPCCMCRPSQQRIRASWPVRRVCRRSSCTRTHRSAAGAWFCVVSAVPQLYTLV